MLEGIRKPKGAFWGGVIACLAPLPSGAVIALNGSGNTTAPGSNPAFANVGTLNGASVIYLGNQWVLTAYHVAGVLPASVSFGGLSYATTAGSWQRLTNNGDPGMDPFADIVVFRLAADPGLSTLDIRSTTPTVGAPVMMIGNSRDQQATITLWNIDTGVDPWTWTETAGPAYEAAGYKTGATNTVRWGVNDVAATGLNVDDGAGEIRSFSTVFDSGAYFYEAQAVLGDSGGAVFTLDGGGAWDLAGMMYAVDTFSGQPANTGVFGNTTYIADLSFYLPQIQTITGVPETTWSWLGALSCFCWMRRRGPAVADAARDRCLRGEDC